MTDLRPGLTAIVPAAGIGSRMGAECPKQYLQLAGRTILEHTLTRLLSHPAIAQVIVALAPHDRWFETLAVAAGACLFAVRRWGWARLRPALLGLWAAMWLAMGVGLTASDLNRAQRQPLIPTHNTKTSTHRPNTASANGLPSKAERPTLNGTPRPIAAAAKTILSNNPLVDGGAFFRTRVLCAMRSAFNASRSASTRTGPSRKVAHARYPKSTHTTTKNTVIRLNWIGDVLKKIRADFAPRYCPLASPSTSILAEPREKRAEQRRTAR